jgi:hypothetical protein
MNGLGYPRVPRAAAEVLGGATGGASRQVALPNSWKAQLEIPFDVGEGLEGLSARGCARCKTERQSPDLPSERVTPTRRLSLRGGGFSLVGQI